MKGKQDGKAASIGKQVKIYFTAKLRGTGCVVGSNIGEAPHKFRLGDKNMVKGLNIGIEGMHAGEKRRFIVPPSLGFGKNGRPPVPPNSWIQYEIELVDICE
nr:peptidyl-prolyl cis-trans isomerase FKBP43 [Nicotiana tomentosiformis]